MTSPGGMMCLTCKHFAEDGSFTCKAYPQGIPDEIIEGEFRHYNPFPGDNGIIWEYDEKKALALQQPQNTMSEEEQQLILDKLMGEDEMAPEEIKPEPVAKTGELIPDLKAMSHEEFCSYLYKKSWADAHITSLLDAIRQVADVTIFKTLSPQEAEYLYEGMFKIMNQPEGWSLRDVTDLLQARVPALSDYQAERIARTETHKIANKAREMEFKEQNPPTTLYEWIGPDDDRTTQICLTIKERQGRGLPLEELKALVHAVAIEYGMKPMGDWLPHINCRHIFMEVLDYELDQVAKWSQETTCRMHQEKGHKLSPECEAILANQKPEDESGQKGTGAGMEQKLLNPHVQEGTDTTALVQNLYQNARQAGNTKKNYAIGKTAEKLLEKVYGEFKAHGKWSDTEDFRNGMLFDVKCLNPASEGTPVMPRQLEKKQNMAKETGKQWAFPLVVTTERGVELHIHIPDEDFYKKDPSKGDFYLVSLKNSKLIGYFDQSGTWIQGR